MAETGGLDYLYGTEAERYTFYRIPKVLFTDPGFRRITADAKILYGLMLDRKAFYSTSKFTFERLLDDPDNIEANLHPGVISNLEMGYIFEEIIRRFSESHNKDAGQHYTPREVIQLMVNILFYDDNDILPGNNVAKTIYGPACGTGGMLSVPEEYLHKLNASTELMAFGQELNDQTFAICKADMLIKGSNADFIRDGGSRIAIIHNGSPLFTGDASSGPSEIRKYILENDPPEAIIALPNDI